MSSYSAVAGAKAARWIQLQQIKNGTVPLLKPEELAILPEKPAAPGVRFSMHIGTLFIFLYLACMLSLPFVFYALQQAFYTTPETLIFENMIPAVLSFFPGIGMAYLCTVLVYILMKGLWPQLDVISAYYTIITTNKMYWNISKKHIPWERGITKKHIEQVIRASNRSQSLGILVCLLTCLPLYYMLFTSYRHVTTSTWIESTIGKQTSYPLENVTHVNTVLSLTEETDDGETELKAHMDMEVYMKGETQPYELCTPACFYTQEGVKKLIKELKKGDTTFSSVPLKAYQREFIQQDKNSAYLLDIYTSAAK